MAHGREELEWSRHSALLSLTQNLLAVVHNFAGGKPAMKGHTADDFNPFHVAGKATEIEDQNDKAYEFLHGGNR